MKDLGSKVKTWCSVRSLSCCPECLVGGAASMGRAERVVAVPSTFYCPGCAWAVREPSSCPQGTLKELQYLNSQVQRWEYTRCVWAVGKRAASGREGEEVCPEPGRKEQKGRGRGSSGNSLPEVQRNHQREGGLQSLAL